MPHLVIPNENGKRIANYPAAYTTVCDWEACPTELLLEGSAIATQQYLFINTDISEQGIADLDAFVQNWITENQPT